MTQAKDLGLNDIGKLVKFATHRVVGDGFTHGSESVVMGTLDSVIVHSGDVELRVSGKSHSVTADEDIEVQSSVNAIRNIVVNNAHDAKHTAEQIRDALLDFSKNKKKEEDK